MNSFIFIWTYQSLEEIDQLYLHNEEVLFPTVNYRALAIFADKPIVHVA